MSCVPASTAHARGEVNSVLSSLPAIVKIMNQCLSSRHFFAAGEIDEHVLEAGLSGSELVEAPVAGGCAFDQRIATLMSVGEADAKQRGLQALCRSDTWHGGDLGERRRPAQPHEHRAGTVQ